MRGALSLYAFLTLGFYLVFPKYGEDGWKAFVPIWRLGIHARHMGMRRSFRVLCIVSMLVLVMQLMGFAAMRGLSADPNSGWRVAIMAFGDLGIYMSMALFLLVGPAFLGMLSARTARRFGKPLWFAAGLCLLWPAFMIALGVDKGATFIPDKQTFPSRDERLVDLGFAVLAVVFAFALFIAWATLSFSLMLPTQ